MRVKIEVSDVARGTVREIEMRLATKMAGMSRASANPNSARPDAVSLSRQSSPYWARVAGSALQTAYVDELPDGCLLVVDCFGGGHVLEVSPEQLRDSLEAWAASVGRSDTRELELNVADRLFDFGEDLMTAEGEEIEGEVYATAADGEGEGEEGEKVRVKGDFRGEDGEGGNGEGDGEGEGDGKGKGKGSGEGEGEGEGDGDGDGNGTGNGRGQGGGQGRGGGGGKGKARGFTSLPDPSDPVAFEEALRRQLSVDLPKYDASRDAESDENVPKEVKEAARAARAAALKNRLDKLGGSKEDLRKYALYKQAVAREIRELRVTLEALEARKNERAWLKNKTDGELDDHKLIDGLTGERAVYKYRGERPPEMGAVQRVPKRVHCLFDLSMSMSRYSFDGRLQRSLEAATMLMEGFRGMENKYEYKISGHSGDTEDYTFVEEGKPPKSDVERFRTILRMYAHAEECDSGDNT